jgi:hypothetical protein
MFDIFRYYNHINIVQNQFLNDLNNYILISLLLIVLGLSLLFENSSRAREITLYTTTYSLDILYNKYQETRAGQSIILITIIIKFYFYSS